MKPGQPVVAQAEGVEGAGVLEGRLLNLADVVVIQLKKISLQRSIVV